MAFGDTRRLRALSAFIESQLPILNPHVEHYGSVIPGRGDMAVVCDVLPGVRSLFYPVGHLWQSKTIVTDPDTNVIEDGPPVVTVANSDEEAKRWAFDSMRGVALDMEVMATFTQPLDANTEEAREHRAALSFVTAREAQIATVCLRLIPSRSITDPPEGY